MKLPTLLCLAALAFAPAALAHSDAATANAAAPNGGQMRDAGGGHLELLVKPGEISLWITDHAGQPVASQGALGSATVLAGKNKTSVKLAPAGNNLLRGSGQFAPDPAMKVVVTLTLPGKAPLSARFTPLEGVAQAADGHDHKH